MVGEFQKSQNDIDKVLKLEKRHFGALAGQGLVNIQLRNYEKAIKIKPNFTDYCAKGDNGGNCARAIPQPDKTNNYLYPRDWNDYDYFATQFYKFSGGSVKDFKNKFPLKNS